MHTAASQNLGARFIAAAKRWWPKRLSLAMGTSDEDSRTLRPLQHHARCMRLFDSSLAPPGLPARTGSKTSDVPIRSLNPSSSSGRHILLRCSRLCRRPRSSRRAGTFRLTNARLSLQARLYWRGASTKTWQSCTLCSRIRRLCSSKSAVADAEEFPEHKHAKLLLLAESVGLWATCAIFVRNSPNRKAWEELAPWRRAETS